MERIGIVSSQSSVVSFAPPTARIADAAGCSCGDVMRRVVTYHHRLIASRHVSRVRLPKRSMRSTSEVFVFAPLIRADVGRELEEHARSAIGVFRL